MLLPIEPIFLGFFLILFALCNTFTHDYIKIMHKIRAHADYSLHLFFNNLMAMSFLFCLGKKIIVEEINVGRKLAKVTYTVIFALCNTQGLTVREQ